MTELTLDKLDYYLPSQYVFITTRGALVKTEVLEDKNIRPSATDPFNYRIPFIPGVPSVDSPIYDPALNFEDNNSQGILGDPAQPKIKLVEPINSNTSSNYRRNRLSTILFPSNGRYTY